MSALHPDYHIHLATQALKAHDATTAYAHLKTAQVLAPDAVDHALLQRLHANEATRKTMPLPTYVRLERAAQVIRDLHGADNDEFSVLDIGGGKGLLSHFLGNADYMLCEPQENTLLAHTVQQLGRTFDFVVSVHVLEHVPAADRAQFLTDLLALAGQAVILIVPIAVKGFDKNEVQRLIYKHRGAPWAKEHLECGLPSRESILELGEHVGAKVREYPGTDGLASMLGFFFDDLGALSRNPAVTAYFKDVDAFFKNNTHLFQASVPTGDHIFVFTKDA
jgi:hypothetical protein